jgi:hypothetical protein
MAHTFEIMSSVCGQLNSLSKDYMGNGKARTMSKIMDSLCISVGRSIASIDDILIDKEKEAYVDKGIFASTGDKFHPVYVLSIKNIKKPFIDRITTMARTSDNDLVVGMVIGVPYMIFDENTSFNDVCKIIKDMYFQILDTDKYMSFTANFGVIKFSDSSKVRVPTYDLSMVLAAVCCMYVNIKSWFSNNSDDSSSSRVPPEDMINALDTKLSEEKIKGLVNTINRHAAGVNDIRDSLISGSIIRDFL